MKKLLLGIGLIVGCLVASPSADAQIHIGVGIRVGPPPPRREVIVERPYRDAVWIAGYYDWKPQRREYIWVPGRWARPPRARAEWVAGRWARHHHEWVFYEGHWQDRQPARGRVRKGGDRR